MGREPYNTTLQKQWTTSVICPLRKRQLLHLLRKSKSLCSARRSPRRSRTVKSLSTSTAAQRMCTIYSKQRRSADGRKSWSSSNGKVHLEAWTEETFEAWKKGHEAKQRGEREHSEDEPVPEPDPVQRTRLIMKSRDFSDYKLM